MIATHTTSTLTVRYLLAILTSVLALNTSPAQSDEFITSAIANGRTTGTVGALNVKNPTNRTIQTEIGPFLMVAESDRQALITTHPIGVSLPPGGAVTISIQDGLCVDISRPAPDNGTSLTLIPETTVSKPYTPDTRFSEIDGFTPVTRPQPLLPKIPGYEHPILYNTSLSNNLLNTAPLLFEGARRIELAYDSLKQAGRINTPLEDPAVERETVLQQSYWLYTSALAGNSYQQHDFEQNVWKDFERNTGMPASLVPEGVQRDMRNGMNRLWATFIQVNMAAVTLNPLEVWTTCEETALPVEPANCCLPKKEPASTDEQEDCPWPRITFKEPAEKPEGARDIRFSAGLDSVTYYGGKPSGYRQCILPATLATDYPGIDIGVFDFKVLPDQLCCKKGTECQIYEHLKTGFSSVAGTLSENKLRRINSNIPDNPIRLICVGPLASYLAREILMDRAGVTTSDPAKAQNVRLIKPDYVIDGTIRPKCCAKPGEEGRITMSIEVHLIDPDDGPGGKVLSSYTAEMPECFDGPFYKNKIHGAMDNILASAFKQFEQVMDKDLNLW